MSICEQIRKARLDAGLSQYDLANKIKDLNQSQISKIENGIRKLKAEEIVPLAHALKVDASKFLE